MSTGLVSRKGEQCVTEKALKRPEASASALCLTLADTWVLGSSKG